MDRRRSPPWILRFLASCLLGALHLLGTSLVHADEGRRIPDDNLAYPVMVDLLGSLGLSGSGFYLNSGAALYLVSAKHVFLVPGTGHLRAPTGDVTSSARDPKDPTLVKLHLDLAALQKANAIRAHESRDVVIIRLGTVKADGRGQGGFIVEFAAGVHSIALAPSGVVSVAPEIVSKYAEALVANEVLVFGYPKSLGLKKHPQVDYARPLLRSGIVAGRNDAMKTLVLDCPAYPGNSGGPVVQFVGDWPQRRLRVVGLVTEFVPVAEEWLNTTHGYTNTSIGNSGYSIAEPMDSVLELVSEVERSRSGR